MSDHSVTVVIPAYQSAKTIGRAVGSLLAQTRPPREIIVVDDGSTDDLAAALGTVSGSITLLRKPNGGASSARNLGIDHARTNWVAFLDADDYWEPTKLECQLSVLDQHPEVGLIASRWFIETPGTLREIEAWHDEKLLDHVMRTSGPAAFHLASHLWTSTLLIRRDVIGENRFESGLEPAEDRDLWARLVPTTPVYFLSKPLATYVQESGGISRSNIDRDCQNMLRVIHRHARMLGSKGVREHEAILYRRWASIHLARRNPMAAVAPARQRLKRNPLSVEAWWVLLKSAASSARSTPPLHA